MGGGRKKKRKEKKELCGKGEKMGLPAESSQTGGNAAESARIFSAGGSACAINFHAELSPSAVPSLPPAREGRKLLY